MNAHVQAAEMDRVNAKTTNSSWMNLYKVGGAAALLTVLFFPIQVIVFIIKPPPSTVLGWFNLFQESKLIGLLDLDLLLIVDQVLTILVFLALYVALRRVNESFMAIGTVIGVVSAVLFIASNPAFEMLSLSNRYAAAGTEAQKALSLAAGQALIASWQGSAFQTSYLIGSLAAIIISGVMLKSRLFSKTAAIMGILANAIALGLYVPKVGVYISVFSVVFLWVWYLLIGLRLFQLGRTA